MNQYPESQTPAPVAYSERTNNASLQQKAERHVDAGLEKISHVLDRLFRVPGTEIRFGLDPIIGFLLPVAGDSLTTLISIYIVLRSIQYGLPKIIIGRMVFNIALDYVVGSVPLVGDLLDFAFQANKKNVELLNRFAGDKGRAHFTDYLWLIMLLALLGGVILGWLFLVLLLINRVFAANHSLGLPW